MNEEAKTERKNKSAQKRGIIIAFSIMAAIVLIWYAGVPAVTALYNMIKPESNEKIDYTENKNNLIFTYDENYNEDIYADEVYMGKDRALYYSYGGNTYAVTDGNYEAHGSTIAFFGRYFDTVINGRYEEYNSYFTKEYFEHQKHRERFTPQKIYDIVVTLVRTEESGSETSYYYYVDYKIYENNGSFRSDMLSDCVRTLVYQLIEYRDGTILINYIGR